MFRKREKMMRGREINHHQRKYKNQIFYLVDFSIQITNTKIPPYKNLPRTQANPKKTHLKKPKGTQQIDHPLPTLLPFSLVNENPKTKN